MEAFWVLGHPQLVVVVVVGVGVGVVGLNYETSLMGLWWWWRQKWLGKRRWRSWNMVFGFRLRLPLRLLFFQAIVMGNLNDAYNFLLP